MFGTMRDEFKFSKELPKVIQGIIPILSFPIFISGRIPENAKGVSFLSITGNLSCDNKFVQTSVPKRVNVSYFNSNIHDDFSFDFSLNRIIMEALEKHRQDDISFQIDIQVLYQLQREDETVEIRVDNERLSYDISQKKWNNLLSLLGYGEYWVFELSQIDIEGMSEVVKHLKKAQADLVSNSFEESMTNVRSAWNCFNPLLQAKMDDLTIYFDSKDNEESNYDPKSKRVKEMKRWIANFVQIGVHRENYVATYLDAELSFYQSVSMISYLSKSIGALKS